MTDQWNPPPGWQAPQQYNYPGQDPRYGRPPAPKRKRSKAPYILIGLVVLVALIAIGAAAGGKKKSGAPASVAAAPAASATAKTGIAGPLQHPEDVKVTSCGTDQFGDLTAQIVVTNTSSKASTYAITLNFESTDGRTQYGEGAAFVNTLAPGQRTPQQVLGSAQAPSGVTIVCKVTGAQRTQAFD